MRLAWLMAGMLAAPSALLPAQNRVAAQNQAALTGIAQIALRVSDVDQEANFFGKLGFEEAYSHLVDDHELTVTLKINDRQFIEISPRTDASQQLGLIAVGYETPDLKGLRQQYMAEGLRPSLPRPSPEDDIVFSLAGPDGLDTEITQYLPEGRQMMDRGQHLGERRVSDELMGFEMPAANLQAARGFYEKLGFTAASEGHDVRLTLPANGDLRIELHTTRSGDQPELLFPVEDARRAADELKKQHVRVVRNDKLVFVRDPDGNVFVLLQTSDGSRLHLLPWHR